MVDEIKSFKESIKKTLLNNVPGIGEDELGEKFAGNIAKSLINQALSKAGKSKDDVIQILGREIGLAMAAVLREPLEKLVDSKKIQISLELVGKNDDSKSEESNSKSKNTKQSQSKTQSKKSSTKVKTKKSSSKKETQKKSRSAEKKSSKKMA